MAFIETVPQDQATGATAELYASDEETLAICLTSPGRSHSDLRYTPLGAD